MTILIDQNQHVSWIQTVAAIPAAVMLWTLLAWNPKTRRQWLLAAAFAIYIAGYYFLFIYRR